MYYYCRVITIKAYSNINKVVVEVYLLFVYNPIYTKTLAAKEDDIWILLIIVNIGDTSIYYYLAIIRVIIDIYL